MSKRKVCLFIIAAGYALIILGCFLWSPILGLIVSGMLMIFWAGLLDVMWKKEKSKGKDRVNFSSSSFKPLHPCSKPGCPLLTKTRFCQLHEIAYKKQADDRRKSSSERGYNHLWHLIRNLKLSESPLCERCLQKQVDRIAVLVHHRDRNPRNNVSENLESLCVICHDDEHKGERWGR